MDKFCLECYRTVSSSKNYLKTELLRRNTDPEVAVIRVTKGVSSLATAIRIDPDWGCVHTS